MFQQKYRNYSYSFNVREVMLIASELNKRIWIQTRISEPLDIKLLKLHITSIVFRIDVLIIFRTICLNT